MPERICTQCGQSNESVAKFCENCGTVLASQSEPVEPGQEVCGKCNQTLDESHISAFGKKWHKACFSCVGCGFKIPSFAKFYEKSGSPMCGNCFKKEAGPAAVGGNCKKCKKPVEGTAIAAFGSIWHPGCMRCIKCGKGNGVEKNEVLFEDDPGVLLHLACLK